MVTYILHMPQYNECIMSVYADEHAYMTSSTQEVTDAYHHIQHHVGCDYWALAQGLSDPQLTVLSSKISRTLQALYIHIHLHI